VYGVGTLASALLVLFAFLARIALPAQSLQDQSGSPTTQGDAAQTPPVRVRVSQGVSSGLLIKRVIPKYPKKARKQRIQGQVILRAKISKEGDIVDLVLISGHPMLAPAAMDAVKQWKYKPYLLKGEPVEVDTEIVVNFTLSDA
jgi:TonB family protein